MKLLDLVAKLSFDDSEFKSGVKSSESGITGLGKTIAGVVSAGAILKLGKDAITTGMNFDSAMSQVGATMGLTQEEINSTDGVFQKLRKTALEMGSSTKFSASEAAEGLNYLAMSGMDADTMMKALPITLQMAGASGIDLATTCDKLTNIMSALGLASKDSATYMDNMGAVTDVFALTSTKANTDVMGLYESISQVGATARVMQDPLTELSVATGILADNDIQASEAGTILRNLLLSLTAPTDKAKKAMDELGFSAFDTNGELRPMQDILQELNSKFSQMTTEEKMNIMNKIFNKTDLKGINALLGESGDRWDELQIAIEECEGSAEQMYKTQNDNLKGSLTELSSAVEGLKIAISDKLTPAIRPVVEAITKFAQEVTKVIQGAEDANPVLKALAMVLTALAGAFVAVKIASFISSLASMVGALVLTIGTTGGLTGALGLLAGAMSINPITLIIGAIGALITAFIYLWNTSEGFRNFWINLWNGIKSVFQPVCEFLMEGLGKIKDWFGFEWDKSATWGENLLNLFKQLAIKIPELMFKWLSFLPVLFWKALGAIIDYVVEWSSNMWNNFIDMCKNILRSIGEWFSQLPQLISEWLSTTIANVSNWVIEMIGKFIEMCTNILQNIKEWFSQLPYAIGYWLSFSFLTVVSWVDDMCQSIWNLGVFILQTIVEFFSQLPGKIWDFLKMAWDKTSTWAVDMWNKFTEMCVNIFNSVVEWFSKLPGKIWEFLTSAWQKVSVWASDMWNKFREMCINVFNVVVEWFSQLPGKLWNFLMQAIQKVGEFASNMRNKASEAGRWFSDTLINIVSQIPSQMINIGKNIVQGVWNGIKSMASTFMNNVKNFFSGIVDGAKSALGIHSPSREMRDEVGKWIPAGVGVGIERAMPDLERQLQEDMENLTNVKFTPKIDSTLELANSINSMNQRNIEVQFNVDGREFNRQVVAPYQDVVSRYNDIRRVR